MEMKMGNYETIFVINHSLTDEEVAAVSEKFQKIISKNGEIVKVDDWGLRKLAYEIDDKTEGHYVLVEFKAPGDFIKELERRYRITDAIMRSIVIRK